MQILFHLANTSTLYHLIKLNASGNCKPDVFNKHGSVSPPTRFCSRTPNPLQKHKKSDSRCGYRIHYANIFSVRTIGALHRFKYQLHSSYYKLGKVHAKRLYALRKPDNVQIKHYRFQWNCRYKHF